MKRTINDWEPEVKSLLETLKEHGFTPVHGDNGEEEFSYTPGNVAGFIENLIACDEARLFVRDVHNSASRTQWLYLVLGNSPGELVSDYVMSPALDLAVDAHSESWTGRKQPTKIVER